MDKINFQNSPNTTTPVNATNLNQVQTNVENEFNNKAIMSKTTTATSYKDITIPGVYSGSSSNDCPYTGTLILFNRGSTNYRTYFFIRYDGLLWISTYWNGTWTEWTRIGA